MKTQLTTRCLLRIILCILALGCCARAGELFFDDFSDGNIQDDRPVTWQWNADGGQCTVTPNSLQFRPSQSTPHSPATWLVASAQKYGTDVQVAGNVSIRAQLNIGAGDQARGLVGLRISESLDGYILVVTGDEEGFFFAHADGTWIPSWSVPNNGIYDPQEDVIIQLDAIDIADAAGHRTSRLEARVWVPGEEMPIEPQIVVTDDKYASGCVSIGAATNEPTSPSSIVFRWVQVTGSGVESEPIVDFNGDGKVDLKDLLRLIESWGQDDPLVDIAPPPFGDGIVDALDLELFMSQWGQPVDDPTLLAHWALDEAEGAVAYDSAGVNDAFVVGGTAWQSSGGQVDGALQLGGVDGCAVAVPVLNPSDGPFSVFAWVNGGAPGQIVLSQQGAADWLIVDTEGNLMTELKSTGRFAGSLQSQTIITDGDWHRIGLVWDGSYRSLYVDGAEVARDVTPLSGLEASAGGLYIGTGNAMTPGTYFSGLIDDIRIYNRVVSP